MSDVNRIIVAAAEEEEDEQEEREECPVCWVWTEKTLSYGSVCCETNCPVNKPMWLDKLRSILSEYGHSDEVIFSIIEKLKDKKPFFQHH